MLVVPPPAFEVLGEVVVRGGTVAVPGTPVVALLGGGSEDRELGAGDEEHAVQSAASPSARRGPARRARDRAGVSPASHLGAGRASGAGGPGSPGRDGATEWRAGTGTVAPTSHRPAWFPRGPLRGRPAGMGVVVDAGLLVALMVGDERQPARPACVARSLGGSRRGLVRAGRVADRTPGGAGRNPGVDARRPARQQRGRHRAPGRADHLTSRDPVSSGGHGLWGTTERRVTRGKPSLRRRTASGGPYQASPGNLHRTGPGLPGPKNTTELRRHVGQSTRGQSVGPPQPSATRGVTVVLNWAKPAPTGTGAAEDGIWSRAVAALGVTFRSVVPQAPCPSGRPRSGRP